MSSIPGCLEIFGTLNLLCRERFAPSVVQKALSLTAASSPRVEASRKANPGDWPCFFGNLSIQPASTSQPDFAPWGWHSRVETWVSALVSRSSQVKFGAINLSDILGEHLSRRLSPLESWPKCSQRLTSLSKFVQVHQASRVWTPPPHSSPEPKGAKSVPYRGIETSPIHGGY